MDNAMTFPDTVEEFMEQYKMVDAEQVYSNGTEYVPIFRMKQWFEHAEPIRHGRWTRPRRPKTYERYCSCCGEKSWYCGIGDYNYCPNCGAKMDLKEGE